MVKNSHKLSKFWDRWFLAQNKEDEYLLAAFRPGDIVVVCAKCHRVWLVDTWQFKNRCPNGQCHHTETEPFGKGTNRISLKANSRIKIIKNANSGFVGSDKVTAAIEEQVVRMDRFAFSLLKAALPYVLGLVLGTGICLTTLQFKDEESPINGRTGQSAYYQDTIEIVKSRVVTSFSETVSESKATVEDVFETVTDSAVDILAVTQMTAEENFEIIKQSVMDAAQKQIDAIKEEYGIGE